MAATLVHFGIDSCNRLLVLKRFGYRVHNCGKGLSKLDERLRSEPRVDAILFSECKSAVLSEALHTSRSVTSAPIILFETADSREQSSECDLVVPPFTPPEEWLAQIERLIQRTRQNLALSKAIHAESQELRSKVRGFARMLCDGAGQECSRAESDRTPDGS